MTKRWGMVIDLHRCVGCQACTVACQEGNHVPPGQFWNLVVTVGPIGTYPQVGTYYLSRPCMHCAKPPCVDGCPTRASHIREDGLVLVDEDKCVGCGYCIVACPYGVRYYNDKLGIAQKCTFCVDRLAAGQLPLCVSTCPQKARFFGDLGDASSEVYRFVHTEHAVTLLPEYGTEPSVYYIWP